MQHTNIPSAHPCEYVRQNFPLVREGEPQYPINLKEINFWVDADQVVCSGLTLPNDPKKIKFWVGYNGLSHSLPSNSNNLLINCHSNGVISYVRKLPLNNEQLTRDHHHGNPTSFPSAGAYSNFHSNKEHGSSPYQLTGSNTSEINQQLRAASNASSQLGYTPKPKLSWDYCEGDDTVQLTSIGAKAKSNQRPPCNDATDLFSGRDTSGLPPKPTLFKCSTDVDIALPASIGAKAKSSKRPPCNGAADLFSAIDTKVLEEVADDANNLSLLIDFLKIFRKEKTMPFMNICAVELVAFLKLMDANISRITAGELRWTGALFEQYTGLMKLDSVSDIRNHLTSIEMSYNSHILIKLIEIETILANHYSLEAVIALVHLYDLNHDFKTKPDAFISLLELIKHKGFVIIPAIEVLKQIKIFEIKHPIKEHEKGFHGMCSTDSSCKKAELLPISKVFLHYFEQGEFKKFGSVTCDNDKGNKLHDWKDIFYFDKFTGKTTFQILDKMLISHCFKHNADMCWFCSVSEQVKHSEHSNTAIAPNMSLPAYRLPESDEHTKKMTELHQIAWEKAQQIQGSTTLPQSEQQKMTENSRQIGAKSKLLLFGQYTDDTDEKSHYKKQKLDEQEQSPTTLDSGDEDWATPPSTPPSSSVPTQASTQGKQDLAETTTENIVKTKPMNAELVETEEQEIDEEKVSTECQICYDNFNQKKWRVSLDPCGHARICQICVEEIKSKANRNENKKPTCPFCREAFKSNMRIYL